MKMNKKNIISLIITIVVLILLSIIITSIVTNKKITLVEKIKLTEQSDEVSNYLEYIIDTDSKEIDKYIIYALKYSYAQDNNDKVSIKKVKDIIKNTFNVKISEDKIEGYGINPAMNKENITYDFATREFNINAQESSYAEIANTPVIKYEIKNISKKNNEKYVITYQKYVVKNPYDILNYYSSLEDANNDDIMVITNYLKGKESISNIKKYINDKNIKKIGKKDKEFEVTYVVKNNKILIDSIE